MKLNKVNIKKFSIVLLLTIVYMLITAYFTNSLIPFFITFLGIILGIIVLIEPDIYIYLFICIYPIIPDYFRIKERPGYLFLTMTLIAVFLYRCVKKRERNILEVFRTKPYRNIFLIYIVMQFVIFFINAEVLNFLKFILQDISIIIILYCFVNTKEKFERMINVIIFTSSIICISGLVEYFFDYNIFSLIENYTYSTPSFGSESMYRLGAVRIEQSFNHAITYCIYLLFCSSLVIYKINLNCNRKIKYYISLILILTNALFTMSRGPLIFLLLNLFIIILFLEKKKKRKVLIVLGGGLCFFIVIELLSTSKVFEMFNQIFYMILGLFNEKYRALISSDFGGNLDPFQYRISLINSVIDLVKNNWLLGLGAGTDVVFTYNYGSGMSSTVSSIDNNYLYILVGHGVLGVSSFLIYNIGCIIHSIKSNKYIIDLKSGELSFNVVFCSTLINYLFILFTVAQMHESRILILYISLMLIYNKVMKKDTFESEDKN